MKECAGLEGPSWDPAEVPSGGHSQGHGKWWTVTAHQRAACISLVYERDMLSTELPFILDKHTVDSDHTVPLPIPEEESHQCLLSLPFHLKP